MEKTVQIFLIFVFVITSTLVIPIYEIIAEKDSISKEIQWCCAPKEGENDNDDYRD